MELKERVLSDEKVKKILAFMKKKDISRYDSYSITTHAAQKFDVHLNTGGETKYVLESKSWDFVLKFTNESYSDVDYPRIESINYKRAKERNIYQIFLETILVTTINDLGIYAQPRYNQSMLDVNEFMLDKKLHNLHSKEIVSKCHNAILDGYRLPRLWTARVLQLYGKEFMRRFEEYTHTFNVNDLHARNVGFYKNRPIILDYSGYHGTEWSSSDTDSDFELDF